GDDERDAGREEPAQPKKKTATDVQSNADDGQYIGIDMAESQPANNRVNDSLSCASDTCAKHLSGTFLLAALCLKSGGRVRRISQENMSLNYCPASSSSCSVRNCRISKLRAPAGVRTTTSSPSVLPIKLRPTGEVVEIKPCAGSLSSGVTRRYVTSSSFSASNSTNVDPYDALSRGTLFGSIEVISLILWRSSTIRALTTFWRSSAARYSEFSRRSPNSSARLISLGK